MNEGKPHRPLLTALLERPACPLPDWPPPFKRIVVQALTWAWKRLTEEITGGGGSKRAESEVEISAFLEKTLNEIQVEEDHPSGFSGTLFQTVVRGAEMTSFDGTKLEKRPDLTFRLFDVTPGLDRALYGLFAECKIVGPDHPARNYCEKGIARFVVGDYAWAMPSALMVAYAHQDYTVSRHLVGHLQGAACRSELGVRMLPRLRADLPTDPPVYESVHSRSWVYPGDGRSPGDISILHLWFSLP